MILKNGTLCITIGANDPRNSGRVVRVLHYLGDRPKRGQVSAYLIEVVNGVPFASTKRLDANGVEYLTAGTSTRCSASRHNLRPLVEPDLKIEPDEVSDPMEPVVDAIEAFLTRPAGAPTAVLPRHPRSDADESGIVTYDLDFMGMTLEEFYGEEEGNE